MTPIDPADDLAHEDGTIPIDVPESPELQDQMVRPEDLDAPIVKARQKRSNVDDRDRDGR